ncbi:hypothetical protein [Psychrobacter ciconiae]|uniref:hypothetical protein n=1 Tax=Psychrobacter ciconiae TaxID=1553449 RepID=UPI0019196D82|nr:hypothetical protein [Psychrobacter ciconiae]
MAFPAFAEFDINNQRIQILAFNSLVDAQSLNQHSVNIIASGPSVLEQTFSPEQLSRPTIFVNGSISLQSQYDFDHVAGFVISDARFISHQQDILTSYYSGQPLFATAAVFEALAKLYPDMMFNYHSAMTLLFPVDRPWGVKANQTLFQKLNFKNTWLNRKKPLISFASDPNFVIDTNHKPAPIGVSLDVTHGFIEAGTVAYVAAQLAFSKKAAAIHLFGIDLLNSAQPRFYENAKNQAPSKLEKAIYERIVPSFNLLGEVYQQHGVAVINHSPISKDLFTSLKPEPLKWL